MRVLLLAMCLCVAQVQCQPLCAPPDPGNGNGDGSGQPVPGSGINSIEQPSAFPVPEAGEPVTVQVLSENRDRSATVNIVYTVLDQDVHRAFLTVGPLETAPPIGPDIAAIVRIDGQFETGQPLQSRVYILEQDFVADDVIVYIIPDSGEICLDDPNKDAPGVCGCGVPDTDSDGDGTPDCVDLCPNDPEKINPGQCGCGVPDIDSDGDGVADCRDECPDDPEKTEAGFCGCGVPETDTDGDGVPDCIDLCPEDPNKIEPGRCGCGRPETCAKPGPEMIDCNNNGIDDAIDIAEGTSMDCNCNGIPDECDIADMTSADCNGDGIPDECVLCPTLEVVVVFDTSGSLSDEAQILCPAMEAVVENLANFGVSVHAKFLGTTSTGPGVLFPCLEGTVAGLLGTDPPGDLGVIMNDVEDWGLATAIVADRYGWSPGTTRIIMPVSDEGPLDGNPCNDPGDDRNVITQAIASAVENDVIVAPLLGGGANECVKTLAGDLAAGTGGMLFDHVPSEMEIATLLESYMTLVCAVNSACPEVPPAGQNFEDCNDNGMADVCEIPSYWDRYERPSCGDHCAEDCNENGIPDECDIASGTSLDVDPEDGIPDECQYPR